MLVAPPTLISLALNHTCGGTGRGVQSRRKKIQNSRMIHVHGLRDFCMCIENRDTSNPRKDRPLKSPKIVHVSVFSGIRDRLD